MANSDKNIRITPNKSTASFPKIVFTGQANDPITVNVLDDNSLSFSGSAGQLFSLSNNISSGTIFSVNDISGFPSFRINANGTVSANEFSGNFGIGVSNPFYKLQVSGTLGISGGVALTAGLATTSSSSGTLVVTGGAAIGSSLSVGGSLLIWNGANYSALKYTGSNNITYTLPSSIPGTGTSILQTDSSGILSWVPNTGGVGAGSQFSIPYYPSAGSAITGSIYFTNTGSGISIAYPAASTSTSTGALVVTGGVGIGGTLNANTVNVVRDFNHTPNITTIGGASGWVASTASTFINPSSFRYLNNKYIGIGGTYIYYSDDMLNWSSVNVPNLDPARNIADVIYGEGKYVFVQNYTANAGYSTNLTNWTNVAISYNNWFTLAYGNGTFVVTSGGSPYAVSSDGINWANNANTTHGYNEDIKFINGYFYVTNGNAISRSIDGITWQVCNTPAVPYGLAYGNGLYVGGVYNSGTIVYSYDGLNFLSYTGSSSVHKRPYYFNGVYYITTQNNSVIRYSTDGFNWLNSTGFPGWVDNMVYAQGKLYVGSGNTVWVTNATPGRFEVNPLRTGNLDDVEIGRLSPNNANFIDVSVNNNLNVSSQYSSTSPLNGALTVAGGVGIGGTLNANSVVTYNRLQNQSFSGASIGATTYPSVGFGVGHNKTSYGNGVFVSTSSWYTANANYSTDGINWTAVSLPVNQPYPVNFFGNGYFVLAGLASTTILYSTNGQSWSQVSIGNTQSRSWGAYGNGKYVMVGSGATYFYSSNITSWTANTLPYDADWRLAYGNGMFVALGYGSGTLVYSYDAINWSISNTAGHFHTDLYYGNGKFIVTTWSGWGVKYSIDGINWISVSNPGGSYDGNLLNVKYGNGVYAISDNGATILSSTDGITWDPGVYKGGKSIYISYGNNRFAGGRWIDGPTNTVTLDPKFTGEINNVRIGALTPASGDFTNLSSTGSANLVGTVNANNLNILSKVNQTPVLGSFAGTTGWTSAGLLVGTNNNYALAFGNGLFVQIRKTTSYTSFSPDGRQWVGSAMPFAGDWMSIAWGVGKFVAIASVGTTGAYSGNGISWTSMNMPSTAQGWYAVTYGNDKFVAVGNTSTAAYSSDGITWSGSAIANTNWTGVAYGNGTFVAVAGFGISGAYSYDGINWNLINLPNGGSGIKFITYGNGYFVVTNYVSTSINYSRDGINWSTASRSSVYSFHTDLAYGNGIYSIFNYSEASYSYDAINWLNGNSIASTDWQAVAYGNNRFVATSINTGLVGSIDGPSNTLNLHPKFTGDLDNVRIGAKQPAAAEFTNLAAQQPVRFTANTPSTNTTNGALMVLGGVGIGGSLNIGGRVGIGTNLLTSTFNLLTPTSSTIGAFIQGRSSQTADLIDTANSSGIINFSVGANGNVLINLTSASSKGLIIKANASQSVNLLELQNSSSSPLTTFDQLGNLNISSGTASTDSINGALVVLGGVGIGGTVYQRGSFNSGSLTTPYINQIAGIALTGTLTPSTVYYYVVTALDYDGRESLPSSQSTVNTGSNTSVRLQISTIPGARQYRVYRSTTSGAFTNSFIRTTKNDFSGFFYDYGFTPTTGTPPLTNQAFTNKISYNTSVSSGTGNILHGLNIPSGSLSVNTKNDSPLTAVEINGDAAFTRIAPAGTIVTANTGGTLTAGTIYYYRHGFVDMRGNESLASDPMPFLATAGGAAQVYWPIEQVQYQVGRIYRSTNIDSWTNTFIGEIAANSFTDFNYPQLNSSPITTSSSHSNAYISGLVNGTSSLTNLALAAGRTNFYRVNGVPVVTASTSTAAGTLSTNTTYYYKAVFHDNLGGTSRFGPEIAISSGVGSAINLSVGIGQNQGAFVFRSTTPNFTSGARFFTTGSITDDGSISNSVSINSNPLAGYQWSLGNVGNLLPFNITVAPPSNGFGLGIAANTPSITTVGSGSGAGTLTTGTTYYYRIVANDVFGQATSSSQIAKYAAPANGSIFLVFGSSRMGFASFDVYRSTDPNNFTNTYIGNYRNNYLTDFGYATSSGSPREGANGAKDIYLRGINNYDISTGFGVISNGFYTRSNIPTFNAGFSVGPNSGTLTTNTDYYYKLRVNFWANNTFGEVSDPIKVNTTTNTAIYLQWTAIEGAQHYSLYRSTDPRNFSNAILINGIKNNFAYDFGNAVITETPVALYSGSNNVIGDSYGNRLSSLLIMGDNQKLRSMFDAPKFSTYPSSTTGGTLTNNTVFFYTIAARGYTGAISLSSSEIRVDTGANNAISLTWLNVNGATGYDIYRSTAINSWTNSLIASNVQSTTFIDINYPTTTGTPNRLNAYGVGYAQSLFENNYNILARTIFGSVNNVDSAFQNFTVRISGNIFRNTSASTLQVGTGFTSTYTFNGSSNGTELAIASGTGFTGSLFDAHSGGTSRFRINFDGSTSIGSSVASTSTTTGALVVSGGVGIGQSVIVGGDIIINGGRESNSTSTGSLIVRGGVGITGGLYVKPFSLSTKGLVVQANTSQSGNLFELQGSTGSVNTYFTSDGRLRISGVVNHADGAAPKISVLHDNSAGGGILVKGANTDNFAAIEVHNNSGATVRIFPSGLVEAIKYTGSQIVLGSTNYPGYSEFIMFNSPAGLMQFNAGGTIALQRNFNIQGHEIRFIGTATTISKSVVVQLSGANYASTNCTITENIVFRVLTNITTAKGIVIQAATSQTANLLEIQNSSSSTLTSFNASGELNITSTTGSTSSSFGSIVTAGGVGIGGSVNIGGRVGIGTNLLNAALNIQVPSTNTSAIVVRGNTSQSADTIKTFSAAGDTNFAVSANGRVVTGSGMDVLQSGTVTNLFNVSAGRINWFFQTWQYSNIYWATAGTNIGQASGQLQFSHSGTSTVSGVGVVANNWSTGGENRAFGILSPSGSERSFFRGYGNLVINPNNPNPLHTAWNTMDLITLDISGTATTYSGNIILGKVEGTERFSVGPFGNTKITVGTATSATGLIVKAVTSQTGNLIETQSSTGATNFYVSSIGAVSIGSSTTTTNATTGALIVTGGVGIGGALNVGGSVNFSSSIFGGVSTSITPTMTFIGPANDPITLSVLSDNSLSFDGSSGQLFSINNNLSTGWIFSISDISGLPLFRTNADGTVSMGEFGGNVGIGLTNPSYKLEVAGNAGIAKTLFISGRAHIGNTSFTEIYGNQYSPIITATDNFDSDMGIQIENKSDGINARTSIIFKNDTSSVAILSLSGSNFNGAGLGFSEIRLSGDYPFTIDTKDTLIRSNTSDVVSFSSTKMTVITNAESTSTTTGSLVVNGGAGIAKSLNVGGFVSSKPAYATAGLAATQTLTSGTDNLILFTDDSDPNAWWTGVAGSGVSHRFKPNIAALYFVSAQVHFLQGTGSGQMYIQARKNGNTFSLSRAEVVTNANGLTLNLSGTTSLDGNTDYVDFAVFTAGTQNIHGEANRAWSQTTIYKIF